MSFELPKILQSKRAQRRNIAAQHVTGFCAKETGFTEANKGNEGRSVKTQPFAPLFTSFSSVEWTSKYGFKAVFAKLKSVDFNAPIVMPSISAYPPCITWTFC